MCLCLTLPYSDTTLNPLLLSGLLRQGYIADTTSVSQLAGMCAGMGFLAGFVFLCCMPKGRIDGSAETAKREGRRSRRSLALPRQDNLDTDGIANSSGNNEDKVIDLGSDEDDEAGDRQSLLGRTGTRNNGASTGIAERRP